MAIVTRTPHNVQGFNTLYQACVTLGDSEATVTINGFVSIESDILTPQQMNQAIDMSETGQLFANKALRIREVEDRSEYLVDQGVETWESGKVTDLSESRAEELYSLYTYYIDTPSEISASKPYYVETTNGRLVSTSDPADILSLVQTMKHRLDYIYTASGGKADLITRITIAQTQAELDAIQDVRV